MVEGRTSQSFVGTASFVLACSAGLLLAGRALLAWSLKDFDPPGDEVAYGFGLLVAGLLVVAVGILALVLGVVGSLQRRRKRSFAFLGVACGVLVLAVILTRENLLPS